MFKVIIILSCVVLLGTMVAIGVGAQREYCNVTCVTRGNCSNGILLDLDTGRPLGCSKVDDNCTGHCYRCGSSSNTGYCIWEEGGTCNAEIVAGMTCGSKREETCGGLWDDGCTCTTGGDIVGNCTLNQCAF